MLIRKLFRTAWSYKAQFISMIIMITLGMGVFLGFNIEWYTIEYNTGKFFADTHYADYRLYSETGFTRDDLEKISEIEGVEAATRFLSVNLDLEGDGQKSLALDVSEDANVSVFMTTQGAAYDANSDGIWLSDKFAAANDIGLGDSLTLVFKGTDITGEVVGLIKSAEHMICVADSNQLMPDYTTYGFAYISPHKLEGILRDIISDTYRQTLVDAGVPEDWIGELPEELLADELEDSLNSVYAQVHIRSGMEKAALGDAIGSVLGRTVMVTSKDDHVVYKEAQGEAEEGKTMGSILPVLFLAIAMLTMTTTMHRIATNEKIQIGTLKALGFKNRRILRHYTSYGLMIGLLGTGIGVLLGYGIAAVIMSPDGMMGTYFDMPEWILVMPSFCVPVMLGAILLLTLISYLSVFRQLRGNAAETLRPYVPKNMKKSLFERLCAWDGMRFGTKWNIRDIMRHKSRSAMTLVGIIGCMILLVGGLGMKDTMAGFLDLLDHGISNYHTKVNLADNADRVDAEALCRQLDGDWLSQSGISLDGETVTLEIYHNERDLIRVIDEDNHPIDMSDDGVYLCLRLKDRAKVGDTITFSPYGSDDTYTVRVSGYYRSVMTEAVAMTDLCADRLGISYTITSIYTDTLAKDIAKTDIVAGTQDQAQLMETFDSFNEIMDTMVYILVLAAVILGAVVLYNLGVMSYIERSRELATLKVLGFRDRRIGGLLIAQNIWLTVIGTVIGLFAGVGVLQWLLTALAGEYEMKLMLGPLTYSVSILLTFGVSIVVGLMVARKNRNIDMVEALKDAEQ